MFCIKKTRETKGKIILKYIDKRIYKKEKLTYTFVKIK